MKKTNTLWMVSHISAFLNEGVSTTSDGIICWHTDKGEVMLIEETNEIQFVDSTIDFKTHFAIVGLASSFGYTTGDYFTQKD